VVIVEPSAKGVNTVFRPADGRTEGQPVGSEVEHAVAQPLTKAALEELAVIAVRDAALKVADQQKI